MLKYIETKYRQLKDILDFDQYQLLFCKTLLIKVSIDPKFFLQKPIDFEGKTLL